MPPVASPTRNRFLIHDVEDLALHVGEQTAHAVMDLRARDGCVPRTFGERLELVVDVAAERLVVLGLRGFVHLGERLLEFVERDIEVLGKGFERVVLADDVRFDELLHDARTCGFELVGAILVGDGITSATMAAATPTA